MSLICGIVSRKDPDLASAEALAAMLDATHHRARHGQATFVDPADGVALAYSHTANFGQPSDVLSWHEDENLVAAVDGDIYDPASHLHDRAASFDSSRAGAVVASFEAGQTAFPAALDGVFSLFLWDRKTKTLHLATDPLGHKLVYYFEDTNRNLLVFSTELKGVLAHPAVPRLLNRAILPLYLYVGYLPSPFTLVQNASKMNPAEHLSFSPTKKTARRYWRPILESGPEEDFDYWVRRARFELIDAVSRTIGDADGVAVYLSGGVESSVAAAALREAGPTRLQALTLAYKDHGSQYDIQWAEHVGRVTSIPQKTILVDPETDLTPELVLTLFRQLDEPWESAGRTISDHFLSQAALDAGFDSTINGGPGGYLFTYSRARKLAALGGDPGSWDEALHAGLERQAFFTEQRMNRALTQPADMTIVHEASLVNRDVVLGFDQLHAVAIAQILRLMTSRGSLFFQFTPALLGLEERTHLTDTKIVQFGMSVPPVFKGVESKRFDKSMLRESFKDVLQFDPLDREKRAFPPTPVPSWLANVLVPSLNPLVVAGIIRQEYLDWLARNLQQGRPRALREAQQWFVFNCWYQFNIEQSDPLVDVL